MNTRDTTSTPSNEPSVPDLLALERDRIAERMPAQQTTRFDVDAWRRRVGTHQEVEVLCDAFADGLVSRFDLDRVAKDKYGERGSTPRLLVVATLMWGYGPSPRGPLNAGRVLASERLDPTLQNAVRALEDSSPLEHAFDALRTARLPGYRSGFFTNWLHFMGRAVLPPDAMRPLIIDRRVLHALEYLERAHGVSIPRPRRRRARYAAHCELIHGWAGELECEPEQVELHLFEAEWDPYATLARMVETARALASGSMSGADIARGDPEIGFLLRRRSS